MFTGASKSIGGRTVSNTRECSFPRVKKHRLYRPTGYDRFDRSRTKTDRLNLREGRLAIGGQTHVLIQTAGNLGPLLY